MNNSLSPDTRVRFPLVTFIAIIIAVVGITYSAAMRLNGIETRLSNIESTLKKLEAKK